MSQEIIQNYVERLVAALPIDATVAEAMVNSKPIADLEALLTPIEALAKKAQNSSSERIAGYSTLVSLLNQSKKIGLHDFISANFNDGVVMPKDEKYNEIVLRLYKAWSLWKFGCEGVKNAFVHSMGAATNEDTIFDRDAKGTIKINPSFFDAFNHTYRMMARAMQIFESLGADIETTPYGDVELDLAKIPNNRGVKPCREINFAIKFGEDSTEETPLAEAAEETIEEKN